MSGCNVNRHAAAVQVTGNVDSSLGSVALSAGDCVHHDILEHAAGVYLLCARGRLASPFFSPIPANN